ncbi:hypothetical protein HPB52_004348 [Rhipicephalus sanguineus]|uniref:Myosin viia and rab n=1 Tax=Rhipicephalus sanguineus TaxID=34632 RepID=A0A9D4SY88_RHISA|nr:hypothetical protein HPB52_004348 [Rhipicephalus sanguineus]
MEVSRIHRRPPSLQRQSSIRLWDLGWGLWGAFKFVLASLLAGPLRRARLLSGEPDTPSSLTSSPEKQSSRWVSKSSFKASQVCGGRRSWITWVAVLASPRVWLSAATGFAWLLVARWTSLINLTLRWISAFLAALKEADAKSTRRLEEELQGHVRGSTHREVCKDGGKSCAHCSSTFNLLFNRKLVCRECGLFVCRDCATYDSRDRGWYCRLCEQQSSPKSFSFKEECKPKTKDASASSDASGSEDGDDVVCDTYEELLVVAVINKAVEMAQRKYATDGSTGDLKNACEPDIIRTAKKDHIDVGCQSDIPLSDSGQEEEEFTEETESDEFFWSRVKEDPFKYIIEEKIEEEITEAYTESDDDRTRPLSDPEECTSSSRMQVPFPEMGVDIVTPYALDSDEEELEGDDVDGHEGSVKGSDDTPARIWTTCVQDWEDNWLFRQRKRNAALGAFRGGRYAAYYDPINMVIPNPSDDCGRVRLGSKDLDELSEMSEKLSVGSLELSSASDSEEDLGANEVFDKEPTIVAAINATSRATNAPDFTVAPHIVELTGDSWVQISCTVSGYPEPRVWFLRDDLPLPDSEEERFCVENKGYGEWCLRMQSPTPEDEAKYIAVAGNSAGRAHSSISFRLSDLKVKPASKRPVKASGSHVNNRQPSKSTVEKAESEGAASGESSLTYDNTSTFKNVDEQTELVPSVELLNAPPKPGTIAEREHAKWLNAVPLPNNPYSVENLSRRASESRRDSLTTAKTGSSFDTPLEDDNDEDGFCSPVLPSSYLRDYYINNPKLVAQVEASSIRRSSIQSAKSLTSSGDPEETLHSFEEQVSLKELGTEFIDVMTVKRI